MIQYLYDVQNNMILIKASYSEVGSRPLTWDQNQKGTVIFNPRRACAARVTVVGSVCLSVCVIQQHEQVGLLII